MFVHTYMNVNKLCLNRNVKRVVKGACERWRAALWVVDDTKRGIVWGQGGDGGGGAVSGG